MKNQALLITRISICLAVLLVVQFVTRFLGIQLITGSFVNLMLLVCSTVCGIYGGLTLAIISPLLACILGIAPNWVLVPFIIIGNILYVLITGLPFNKLYKKNVQPNFKSVFYAVIFVVLGSSVKFTAIYCSIKYIATWTGFIQNGMASKLLSGAMGITQLFTGLIGGCISLFLMPVLKKIVK